MKRKKLRLISFIMALSLSIPFIFNISNIIKADASSSSDGVKIVDYVAGSSNLVALDEDGHVFVCSSNALMNSYVGQGEVNTADSCSDCRCRKFFQYSL